MYSQQGSLKSTMRPWWASKQEESPTQSHLKCSPTSMHLTQEDLLPTTIAQQLKVDDLTNQYDQMLADMSLRWQLDTIQDSLWDRTSYPSKVKTSFLTRPPPSSSHRQEERTTSCIWGRRTTGRACTQLIGTELWIRAIACSQRPQPAQIDQPSTTAQIPNINTTLHQYRTWTRDRE